MFNSREYARFPFFFDHLIYFNGNRIVSLSTICLILKFEKMYVSEEREREDFEDAFVRVYSRLDCTNASLITSSIARNANKKFELISNLKSKVR